MHEAGHLPELGACIFSAILEALTVPLSLKQTLELWILMLGTIFKQQNHQPKAKSLAPDGSLKDTLFLAGEVREGKDLTLFDAGWKCLQG